MTITFPGKQTFRHLIRGPRGLFLAAAAGTFLFYVAFLLFFRDYLLRALKNNPDILDLQYYADIFHHADPPLVSLILLFVLLFVFYDRVRAAFSFFSRHRRPFLFTVVVVSAVVQLAIAFGIDTLPIADSTFYIAHAERLYATGSYVTADGLKTCFWPVGYPAFLALLHYPGTNPVLLARLSNILFSAALLLILIQVFKRELTGNEMAAFLVVVAFFPNQLFASNTLLTEPVFTTLLWLGILLALRSRKHAAVAPLAGLVLGLCAYLRPAALILPFLFAGFFLKTGAFSGAIKRALLLAAVALLVVLPWTYRNYLVFGEVVPVSSNGGFMFLMGNNPRATGGTNFQFPSDLPGNEAERDRQAFHAGLRFIVENPGAFLLNVPRKVFFDYYRGDPYVTWSLKSTGKPVPPLVPAFAFFYANTLFYFIVLLSLAGFARHRRRVFQSATLSLGLVTYLAFLLVTIFFVGSERYLLPLFPLHAFFFVKFLARSRPLGDSPPGEVSAP